MRRLTLHICLVVSLIIPKLYAQKAMKQENRYKYPLSRYEVIIAAQEKDAKRELERLEFLQTVKFLMINGKLEQAKIMLKEATITDDFTRPAQVRYLAIINFIQNNHKQVVRLLNDKSMRNFSTLPKYCLMHVMSLIVLKQDQLVLKKWDDCKSTAVNYSNNDLAWMQVLVNLSTGEPTKEINKIFQNISIDNLNPEMLRIVLKLSLYLNQQDKVIPRFELLTQKILEDKGFRELIGMNYFRNLNLSKAFQLLEDLETPNAEVFKGNLYLSQNKDHLAYGQYKLALKQKDNSDNALERLIPLAWKLRRFDEGIEYINRFSFKTDQMLYKYTLLAVFSLMAGKKELADQMIRKIKNISPKRDPIELDQLITYNALISNDDYTIDSSALSNCLKKDAIHCWLLYYKNSWPSAVNYLNNSQTIVSKTPELLDEYTNEIVERPLSHQSLIDQKDIEELDNKLIKLIQN